MRCLLFTRACEELKQQRCLTARKGCKCSSWVQYWCRAHGRNETRRLHARTSFGCCNLTNALAYGSFVWGSLRCACMQMARCAVLVRHMCTVLYILDSYHVHRYMLAGVRHASQRSRQASTTANRKTPDRDIWFALAGILQIRVMAKGESRLSGQDLP